MSEVSGPVRGRRRGPAWRRVSYGLHRPAGDGRGRVHDLAAWQLVLPPSGRFTHLTAAEIYGWWLPPTPPDLPVFVAMATHESRPQRRELIVSRHPRVTPPSTVAGQLVDPPADVRAATPRRRGPPLLRRALDLADRRAESAWETLLRVLHVCGAWLRRGYTSRDVLHQAVGVLRDADLSLSREHRPDRVRAWHSLLAESCFTPSGQARLLERLQLEGAASGTGEGRHREGA